jgi:hypothetical protein
MSASNVNPEQESVLVKTGESHHRVSDELQHARACSLGNRGCRHTLA